MRGTRYPDPGLHGGDDFALSSQTSRGVEYTRTRSGLRNRDARFKYFMCSWIQDDIPRANEP